MIRITILLGYLACAVLLSGRVGGQRGNLRPVAIAVGTLAWFAQAWILYDYMLPGPGLTINAGTAVSFFAWLIAGFTLAALARPALTGLATVLLPLCALGALLTGFGGEGYSAASLSWPLKSHILLSAAAYSLLSVAAALAILLAVQDYRLRNHRQLGWFRHLPALEEMEGLMFGAIGAGFAILSLALFSGLIFVDNLFAQHLAHKTVLSLVSWLIFGAIVIGRLRFGWRGRSARIWILGGFVFLALAYFGSKIVLELFLGRQWG